MSPHACAQGEEEEHEAHAGQLEVFASVAVIGDETFAGDTDVGSPLQRAGTISPSLSPRFRLYVHAYLFCVCMCEFASLSLSLCKLRKDQRLEGPWKERHMTVTRLPGRLCRRFPQRRSRKLHIFTYRDRRSACTCTQAHIFKSEHVSMGQLYQVKALGR